MRRNRHKDALAILKLNTELYPMSYNTWDSYGECLLELGENNEALKAYKKSLAINPNNTNADSILSRNLWYWKFTKKLI